MNYRKIFLTLALIAPFIAPLAVLAQQGKTVDRIVAVIGSQIVKESDVESGISQFRKAGLPIDDSLRGEVMEQLMLKKLLVQQAKHDSIEVTESEVEGETDRRMRYFLMQFKSDEEFAAFYGKTVESFKYELHDQVKELLLAQRMQGQITANIEVSPADVQAWFAAQNPDSLPLIDAEVEVGQIVIVPPPNQEIKDYTRANLEDIRQRILAGKLDFCAAARAYSKDPGSVNNCGIYENVRRGTFVPEFDAVSFSLKEGELSAPFETDFGFHIVRLISRKGEEVTIQHILLDIPAAPEDLRACKMKLDTVLSLIRIDSINFCEAASKYSTDADTKYNCGLISNPQTGTSRIDLEILGQIDPDPQFPINVNNMKVGDYLGPQPCLTRDSKQGYRLLFLKSRTKPHRANLIDDYQLIQDMALQDKQQKAIDTWVRKKLATTYLRIDPDYRIYNYEYPWLTYLKS
jgi:peptidyl-prolyl cis-trans isomerase SurA